MNNIDNTSLKNISDMTFNEKLHVSVKYDDIEDWLDMHFIRPVGLRWAMTCMKHNVHPNVVTVISMFLGIVAGVMFSYPDVAHNIIGVVLMLLFTFGNSADGQLARLTGKRTFEGRVLNRLSKYVCFFVIYVAIAIRIYYTPMPGTDTAWRLAGWLLVIIAAVFAHLQQALLADYYKRFHLWMKKGKEGGEIDSYAQQRDIYENLPKKGNVIKGLIKRVCYFNYANYCRRLEKRTPNAQKLKSALLEKYETVESIPDDLRQNYLKGSSPLMIIANLLTYNSRVICLFVACLIDQPWIYPLFEIVVLSCLYIHMHKSHEDLCTSIHDKYLKNTI